MARARATPDSALTPRQEAFVERYLVHYNGNQAAIEAGYVAKNAKQQASALLQHPAVIAHLAERRRAVREEARIDRESVLREMGRIAFLDIRKLYGPSGALLPPHEWPDDVAAAVVALESQEIRGTDGEVLGEVRKLKLADKLGALDKLMRHLGLYEADNKQSSLDSMVNELRSVMQGARTFRPDPANASLSHSHDDEDDGS